MNSLLKLKMAWSNTTSFFSRSLLGFCLLLVCNEIDRVSAQQLTPPDPTDPVGTMGICYHFPIPYVPAASEVNALAAAGFPWIRTDLTWQNVENAGQPGNYYWGYFDQVYNAFHSRGIKILFILDYTDSNYDGGYSPYDNAGRTAFANFAAAAAVHYNSLGGGVVFEIYNEPEYSWRSSSSLTAQQIDQLFVPMALMAAQAIKQAVPNQLVIGPAAGDWDGDLMNDMEAASPSGGVFQYLTGASFHTYSPNPSYYPFPENFAGVAYDQATAFKEAFNAQYPSHHLDIYNTENGWSSQTDGTGIHQAQFMIRSYLYGVYSGLSMNFGYVWHEGGVTSYSTGENFLTNDSNGYGIVDNLIQNNDPSSFTLTPKPAYYACQTYVKQLTGFLYKGPVNTGDTSLYCLTFAAGNKPCYALWSSSGNSYNIKLTLANGSYTLTNYLGTSSTVVTVTNSTLPLTIDGGPQYLVMNTVPGTLPPPPAIALPSSLVSPGSFTVIDSPNGAYSLIMQSDGNLVEYNGSQVPWASNTYHVGTGPYTATLQPSGNLVIVDSTGATTWSTNTANQGVAPYTLSIQNNGTEVIEDSQGKITFRTGNVLISVANVAPPATASVSTPYAFTYTASGYPAPNFSVATGTLPPGLMLSSSGAISGTPTAAGVFTGTIQVSNGVGSNTILNFSITVAPGGTLTDTPTMPPWALTLLACLLVAVTTGRSSPDNAKGIQRFD